MTTLDQAEPGTVAWVDLQTPDLDQARRFYGELFGWSFVGGEEAATQFYTIAQLGGRNAAGMAKLGSEARYPPMWSVYFATDDVDATERAVGEAGGAILVPAMDITDQGRMAYFADPSGALFGAWQGRNHRGAQVVAESGAMVWHEVYTRAVGKARIFYSAVFDLDARQLDAPGIDYWTLHKGDRVVCGAMQMTEQFPPEVPSHWNTYFEVSDVDDSVSRLVAMGGAVVAPAFDTPFGRLAFVADRFGAAFCLMKPTRLPGT